MNATLSESFIRASHVLARVYAGTSLAEFGALEPAVQDLCLGTLRDYGYLDGILSELLQRPITDLEVRALLNCAVREIQRGKANEYAVVNEAVNACMKLGYPAAKGLVNGVLRNYLRHRVEIEARGPQSEAAQWRHPQWWVDTLRAAYPGQWREILAAGNQHPPMSLRINRRRTTVEDYAARLSEIGIEALAQGEVGVALAAPRPVAQLPGFAEGDVSVQDLAAQRAAPLLDLHDGMRVLDACAAPGGKAAHILESADVNLLALDRDPLRAQRIEDNLRRLSLHAEIRVTDAAALGGWWDGKTFDRILLDAPCTASGVVRRHPDIKWLRRVDDIGRFAGQQRALLDSLWRVLSPGGKLLYVTCSVFPAENASQVDAFLSRHADARRMAIADEQLLPNGRHDGFYYALLVKQSG
ncbi:MAG TPA: 16S rRNA (cytosine(967)-C(5))-methyltransferase RsmB [Burkholderiales bacterium]|nr:16S rRNA (cytosine(967)-C(5))-methyltransferase RsmB [Burkholderiales bacterium]